MESSVLSSALKPVLDTSLDAAVVMRRDGTVAGWNQAAEEAFGWTATEVHGRLLGDLIIPPKHREAHARGLKRYIETGEGPVLNKRFEIDALHKDGRTLCVELAITATADRGEMVFLGFMRDITERKRAEAALRESEARLRATYDHAFAGIAEVDAEGRFLRVNDAYCDIVGYTEAELKEHTLFDITHPDDVEGDRRNHQRQLRGEIETFTLEKRFVRRDGSECWSEVMASLVPADGERPAYGIRIIRDISERKRAEERQRLLIHELNHRVKNTLAIVQAIVRQSLRGAPLATDQRRAIEGRLAALSAAHDVITKSSWESVGLRAIIGIVLQPYRQPARDPFIIDGPDLLLRPKTAVTLTMALHELATNAAKYGALRSNDGTVMLLWSLRPDAEGSRLRMSWQELGGPPITPPARRGFGTTMIERGLAGDLGGAVQIDFRPDGLVCILDAPLPEITDRPMPLHQPASYP